jgi:P4 family phage/plasmid primase-like protien
MSAAVNAKKYHDFLKAYSVPKESPKEAPKTNNRIPSKPTDTEKVYGGKFNIPDDKYDEFLTLYSKFCLVDGNSEHLTEKQRDKDGPILIDLDLKYDYAVTDRIHTKEHVDDLVALYLDKLKEVYHFDEKPFYIFVMEKDQVNRVNDGDASITKDGIHIIIGIKASIAVQMFLRTQVLEKIGNMWRDLPIKNTWDDVVDNAVSSGSSGWQLYGSRKPDHQPYKLKYIYENVFDPADNEPMTTSVKLADFNVVENIRYLSARYLGFPSFPMNSNFTRLIENGGVDNGQRKRTYANISTTSSAMTAFGMGANLMDAIFRVKTHAELDALVETMLQLFAEKSEYELVETHKYTMTLPEKYYGPGSYEKWLRVGMALSATNQYLFITWIAFSAQSSQFRFGDISDLYSQWQKFDKKPTAGGGAIVTRRSIMHWSKHEVPTKYNEVLTNSIDYYVEKSLNTSMGEGYDDRRSGDFEIACVLNQMFKHDYVCVSIKNNIWYRFHKHRWMEIDSGTTLRKSISTDVRDVYEAKLRSIEQNIAALHLENEQNPLIKSLKKKLGKIIDITMCLVSTVNKKNIMTEAKDLFYDPQFMEKLDTNPYLLCFDNGVVDFKEKVFRVGYPEDYVSKCTKLDYMPLNPTRDGKTMDEINDFMRKLFPKPQLCEYMWSHLASILLGTPDKQTFHMYIGEGRNGKSVLTTLIDEMLGEYKGVVPLSAITQDRAKVGGTSAELAELKGVRYAVIMEPSTKDAILEGPLKQLTSGLDPIQCRAPYSAKTMIYYPQFKLVLCTNVRMDVKTQDFGTWRRIREVPFESHFTENPDPTKPNQFLIDTTIQDKFKYWKFTFMAMLVKKAFETGGKVEECDVVIQASKRYQESQDFIAEFIRDKIEEDPRGKIRKSELNPLFLAWYRESYGFGSPSVKDVHKYLDKKFGKASTEGWLGGKIRHERVPIEESDDVPAEINANEL